MQFSPRFQLCFFFFSPLSPNEHVVANSFRNAFFEVKRYSGFLKDEIVNVWHPCVLTSVLVIPLLLGVFCSGPPDKQTLTSITLDFLLSFCSWSFTLSVNL